MNILVVNWQDLRNPQAGGAEIHLFEICSRLAARGHRVRLVCSGFDGAPAVEMVDGVEVRRSGSRMSFALLGRRAVRRELEREPADVVVDDINKLPLCIAGVTDRPIYAIVPHLFGTTAFSEVSWPMAATVWLAERLIPGAYRRAWFHVISESTRDDLVARGIPAGRIAVVHPGVDSSHYSPDNTIGRFSPPRFVYIGRLKRYKGVDILLRALALAREHRSDIELDIAGTGDHRDALVDLTARLGLTNAVSFLGFVDETVKLELLRRSVANVFPSPKEGWGITVMEAAACGTPSIASASPGLRDSVLDGQTGVLVPHGDAAALAKAILDLAGSPVTVERLGSAARLWARAHDWELVTDAVAGHLQALIEGREPDVEAGAAMNHPVT